MSLLADVSFWGRAAASNIRRFSFIHFLAIFTLSFSVGTWGLGRWAQSLLTAFSHAASQQVAMVVYLSNTLPESEIQNLALRIQQMSSAQVSFVSKEQAWQSLESDLASLGTHVGALRDNPLESSLELVLPPKFQEATAMERLAQHLRQWNGVSAVDYRLDATLRLNEMSKTLQGIGMIMVFAIALVAVWLVFTTLQLAMLSRRDEIEIQKWIGATDTFVRIPFILEGAFQGGVSGVLALGLVFSCRHLGTSTLGNRFAFLCPPSGWPAFTSTMALEMIVVGVGLGILGSFLAVGRFVRV